VAVASSLGGAGVARAAAPGALDPGFGSGGITTIANAQLFGVAAEPNGEVVAAGETNGAVFVDKLTAAGQPDPSFGSGGIALGPAGVARAVALQSNGQIVEAGTSGGMFAMRLNPNGAADPSFGSGGIARAFTASSGAANAVAVAPNGNIVVAGSVNPVNTQIAVAEFNPNGTPDTAFGSGGSEVLNFGLPYAAAQGLGIQPDGKIVLVGYEQGSPNYGFYNGLVIRLNTNGALDTSFNGSGVVSVHLPNSGYDSLNAVTLQNDGKIVAAGSDVGGPYAVFVRLNTNGSYDTGFGTNGIATLSSGTFTEYPYGAYGVGIGGGGAIIGAGAADVNSSKHAGLWATTAAGAPDSSFGTGGIVDTQPQSEACALAIAPDGSVLVVGQSTNPQYQGNPCAGQGGPNAFVARYGGLGPPPALTPPVPPPTPPTPPTAKAPIVSTGRAGAVSESTARVSATVDPKGAAATYQFQYGTSTAYGSSTPSASLVSGTAVTPVTVKLKRLKAATTYHYRVIATNPAGTSYGADGTFTTQRALKAKLTAWPAVVTRAQATGRAGLVLKVKCSHSCVVAGFVSVSKTIAGRLRLSQHHRTLYRGSTTRQRGGVAAVHLRSTAAGKQALRRHRSFKATLTISARPVNGGPGSHTWRKLIRLRA
ncbi:MAG: hypothetical protein WAL22_00225, partial [Solirubrobacteraceae bacterium]